MKNTFAGLAIASSLALLAPAISYANGSAICGRGAGAAGSDIPCACGNTVVTDTTLDAARDPVVSTDPSDICGDTALFVASNVNLNVGGLRLRGNNSGCGVDLSPGAVERNGVISGFFTGVCGQGQNRIRGNTLKNNFYGITINGTGTTVADNVIKGSGCGYGIYGSVSNSMLLRNTIRDVLFTGIYNGTSAGGNTLSKNSIRFTTNGTGIYIPGPETGDTLDLNEVSDSLGPGIIAGDVSSSSVTRSLTSRNGGDGVYVSGDNNLIADNTSSRNGGAGVTVGGSGNTLTDNYANRNETAGVYANGIGDIDGGGNQGHHTNSGPDCSIDGIPCAP